MLNLPPLSLYVHIPWCERKCPYCDFNSYQSDGAPPFAAYGERLLQDLDADRELAQGRELGSIFFGGGTPSLFPAELTTRLLNGIGARIALAADAEITLEANPGSAEQASFRALRAAGVNRLSLGIQSFDDRSLQALGRVHDAAEAHSAIAAARTAGFGNINLDLMHGLPGQSVAMALADLQTTVAQEVAHISWYQLTVEKNTAFHRHPPQLPAEDLLAEIQDRGEALLQQAGYAQYEVSAWAREDTRSRHNLNYWHFGDYLGIGAGSHGKLTLAREGRVLRTRKTRTPKDYLASSGLAPRIETTVRADEIVVEFMLNVLRLREGSTAREFEQRTGLAFASIGDQLAALRKEGLLECDEQRICTTAQGYRYLNLVLERFS